MSSKEASDVEPEIDKDFDYTIRHGRVDAKYEIQKYWAEQEAKEKGIELPKEKNTHYVNEIPIKEKKKEHRHHHKHRSKDKDKHHKHRHHSHKHKHHHEKKIDEKTNEISSKEFMSQFPKVDKESKDLYDLIRNCIDDDERKGNQIIKETFYQKESEIKKKLDEEKKKMKKLKESETEKNKSDKNGDEKNNKNCKCEDKNKNIIKEKEDKNKNNDSRITNPEDEEAKIRNILTLPKKNESKEKENLNKKKNNDKKKAVEIQPINDIVPENNEDADLSLSLNALLGDVNNNENNKKKDENNELLQKKRKTSQQNDNKTNNKTDEIEILNDLNSEDYDIYLDDLSSLGDDDDLNKDIEIESSSNYRKARNKNSNNNSQNYSPNNKYNTTKKKIQQYLAEKENDDYILDAIIREHGYENIVKIATGCSDSKTDNKTKKIKSSFNNLLNSTKNYKNLIISIMKYKRYMICNDKKDKDNLKKKVGIHYYYGSNGFIYKMKVKQNINGGKIIFKCDDVKCKGEGVLYQKNKNYRTVIRHDIGALEHEYIKKGYDEFMKKMEERNWAECQLCDIIDGVNNKTVIDWHKTKYLP